MEKVLDFIRQFAMSAGFKLIFALLLVLIGFPIINKLANAIKKSRGAHRLDSSAMNAVILIVRISGKILIGITAAAILGVPMTSMITVLGSLGLAIGLALQGSLSNFVGGLMILLFKPFKVGDYIVTKEGEGSVSVITALFTRISTADNTELVIPNGTLANSSVNNLTAGEYRRMNISVGVSYSTDIEKVRSIFLSYAQETEGIAKTPAASVDVSEFGDSSVNIVLRAWVKSSQHFVMKNKVTEDIKRIFDEKKIDIPFPQMDVHIDK